MPESCVFSAQYPPSLTQYSPAVQRAAIVSIPEACSADEARAQMPPPFTTQAKKACVVNVPAGQATFPATPALVPPGGVQRSALMLLGSNLVRSIQQPSAASGSRSTLSLSGRSSGRAPTPATPAAGFNVHGLQPGDPCWYLGPGNARTKAELLTANEAPIIGLEDLSAGLRSVHTQWARLAPMLQIGDLCWHHTAVGIKVRLGNPPHNPPPHQPNLAFDLTPLRGQDPRLAVLRQSMPDPRVSPANDEAAPPCRVSWSFLDPLSTEQAEIVSSLTSDELSQLCDGVSLHVVLLAKESAKEPAGKRKKAAARHTTADDIQMKRKRRGEADMLAKTPPNRRKKVRS